MNYEQKSKAELIEELTALRQQVKLIEAQIADKERGCKSPKASTRPDRRGIRTHIEFIADFDVIEANGINISDGGICFETYENLPFEMRFDLDGSLHYHRANLVWLERIPKGGYRFGLMFTRPVTQDEF